MNLFNYVKKFLLNNSRCNKIVSIFYRALNRNKCKIVPREDNTIAYENTYLKHCRISIRGTGNKIIFKGTNYFKDCSFFVSGNYNTIMIEDQVCGYGAKFIVEDDGNEIHVGYKTLFAGRIEMACTEGTEILIGEHCLFSSDIDIRTGDSHSIVDLEGIRINPAEKISIGNYVWVGHRAIILKGSKILEHCVVGAGAVLTQKIEKKNSVIVGNPARVVKEKIDWKHERI